MRSTPRTSDAAFLLLVCATLVLLARVVHGSMSVSGIAFGLTALVFVGFLSGMMREATSLRALKHRGTDVTPDTSRASVLFAMVFAGNAIAFVLSVHAGL